MNWIKHALGQLILLLDRMKGERCVSEIALRDSLTGHLTGYSISGYEIRLYCRRIQYRRVFKRWWVPSEDFCVYRVFSIVSHTAPPLLKKACELDISLPEMVPHFVDTMKQKEMVIQAYLDILIEKIMLDLHVNFAPTR